MRDTLKDATDDVFKKMTNRTRFEMETVIMACDYLMATKWMPGGWELLEDAEVNATYMAMKKEIAANTDVLSWSASEIKPRQHFQEVWKRHGGKAE